MDTTTPHGELLFSIFGALAQYERALTHERVKAGLAAAKRRGRHGGRPPEIDPEKLKAIITALNGRATKAAVCRTFGTKRTTLIETRARVGLVRAPWERRRVYSDLLHVSHMSSEGSETPASEGLEANAIAGWRLLTLADTGRASNEELFVLFRLSQRAPEACRRGIVRACGGSSLTATV